MLKQKQLYRKKLKTQNIPTDNLLKFTGEDKEHTYHQVVSQLPWLLGLWGELIVLLGGHSQDNDIKKKGKSSAKRKSRRKVKYEKGVPAKYLKNKNSKSQVAAEIRRTAKAYKQGKYINLKAVQKSRATRKK